VRLSTEARVTDKTMGYIMVEAGTGKTDDTFEWGTASAATGGYPFGNAKRGDITLLEGWIQHKWDRAGVKVGHMPLSLGNRLFFDHTKFGDDAIVAFADPSGDIHLAAVAAKLEEGVVDSSLDQNGYMLLAAFNYETFSAGADLTYLQIGSGSTLGAAIGKSDIVNVGLRGDKRFGRVRVRADLELQSGVISNDTPSEMDHESYAFLVGADFGKLGGVDLAAEFGYGAGQSAEDDSEAFITSLSPGIPYIGFVYNTRVEGACKPHPPQTDTGTNTGICNTAYLKGSAGTSITDAISGRLDVIYVQAVEEVALLGGAEDDSDLGIEVDAAVKYKVARNLLYWIEGGYLSPGRAYSDGNADGMYAVRHGIELTF
jgi:hypothetical protein